MFLGITQFRNISWKIEYITNLSTAVVNVYINSIQTAVQVFFSNYKFINKHWKNQFIASFSLFAFLCTCIKAVFEGLLEIQI